MKNIPENIRGFFSWAGTSFKQAKPRTKLAIFVVIAFYAFQLYIALVHPLHPALQSPLHLVLALYVIFLLVPMEAKGIKKHGQLPAWRLTLSRAFDLLLMAAITFVLYYVISEMNRLTYRVQFVDEIMAIDVVAMVVILVLLLEAVRRVLGQVLFWFILVFIVYAWQGSNLPTALGVIKMARPYQMNNFVETMIMGSGGVFGTPLYTSASALFYFIVFGALFSECGGGQLLIDIGMKFSNKSSGGPAKAAVISSGLMGMVSGSAVANVSTTGVMTIPMMKRAGYEPHQAGAIEAVASTGGQIMPPIMGIGAFIMAEMLGIPYGQVAASAIIPALAYFFAVFVLVDGMARRQKIATDADAFIIQVKEPILPRLYLLLPAIILVAYIIMGRSLMRSGMMGICSILICNIISLFVKKGRYYADLKIILKTAMTGAKQAADIAIPTAACGIIIGIVISSGLANRLTQIIGALGLTNLLPALLIAMLGCMLLGMALPTVAAYLVANTLFVPVMVRLGIPALPANMFIFYFGIMAQITPPVCLASFTAAGIAGANPMKTGYTGMLYALVAFLVPFIFIYQPGILLIGSIQDIILQAAILLYGTFLLASGMGGYLGYKLGLVERGLLILAALLLIIPEGLTDILGFGLSVLVVGYCLIRGRKERTREAEAANA